MIYPNIETFQYMCWIQVSIFCLVHFLKIEIEFSLFHWAVLLLRWYGKPCNIYMDDRILKYDYNPGFKKFKIYKICPKYAFIKIHMGDKK